jgi:hypothetical protein
VNESVQRLVLKYLEATFITRSYYRKENAADMYMQDVLQPKSVSFTVCFYINYLMQLYLTSHLTKVHYKVMCISVERASWVNCKLQVDQAAIIIFLNKIFYTTFKVCLISI